MWTTNLLWVLYYQQIGELPNFIQNYTGDMVFPKMASNFTVLEGIFETLFNIWLFFGPSNFTGISFLKLKALSIFLVNNFLVRFILKVIFFIKLKANSQFLVKLGVRIKKLKKTHRVDFFEISLKVTFWKKIQRISL